MLKEKFTKRAFIAMTFFLTVMPVGAQEFLLPESANIRNLKKDYGAKGDGVTDDTAAFQSAYKESGLLYVPDGTYLVSDTIVAPDRKGSNSTRRIIQGQSTERTIIKLKDNTPSFSNKEKPKPVIKVAWNDKIAQAFRNSVHNITIDIGSGNPGAVALDFFASNQGAVVSVVLKSADKSGVCGLRMTGDNGPLLVRDLTVDGFEVGIDSAANHLSTLEHVTVKNQSICGMRVKNKTVARKFLSENNVLAIDAKTPQLVLIDSKLSGQGRVAMELQARMGLIRNVEIQGYEIALKTKAQELKSNLITEWSTKPAVSLFPSSKSTLNLDIAETPPVPPASLQDWADATGGSKEKDVTRNFQRAIDSGKKVVYFPRGEWSFGEVRIRGAVERIIGLENVIKTKGCRLIVDDGEAPVVRIERFDSIYAKLTIQHNSKRTLVVAHMVADALVCNQGCGDVFLEDFCVGNIDLNQNRLWARQLNPEYGERPAIINNGGTAWIFGLKTEGYCTKVKATGGSKTEVFGYILANKAVNKFPMFIVEDSSMSVSIVEDAIRKGPFSTLVEETRKGVKATLPGAPKGSAGNELTLFVTTP